MMECLGGERAGSGARGYGDVQAPMSSVISRLSILDPLFPVGDCPSSAFSGSSSRWTGKRRLMGGVCSLDMIWMKLF